MNTLITDNDSTLMEQEILDEIARYAGDDIYKKIQEITHSQMNGDMELSFERSLQKRVSILCQAVKKITKQDLVYIAQEKMSFSPGVEYLLQKIIQKHGTLQGKFFIFSGGFFEVISKKINDLKIPNHQIDILRSQIYANYFLYGNNDEIIGVDWKKSQMWKDNAKKEKTLELIDQNIISLQSPIIGLGDGSNDIGMVPQKYGFCIAYTGMVAREKTIAMADGKIAKDFFEVEKYLFFSVI